jgi:outer membrane immunogenic protein
MDLIDRSVTRKLLIVALLSGPSAAYAADIYHAPPPPASYPAPVYVPPNTWAGFYVGLNGGYGWGSGGDSILYNDGGAGSFAGGDQSSRAQPQGAFGGGQIGYNLQSGSLVYGVEADFQGAGLSDRFSGATGLGNSFTSRESTDWFGTVRGRLGYSFGRTLLYATGGLAYGDVRQRAMVSDAGGDSLTLGNSSTQTGYAVGGGLEYKIAPAWSLKAEYQYIDLGTEKLNGIDSNAVPVSTNGLDTAFHTARIGLNYHIGATYEPLK